MVENRKTGEALAGGGSQSSGYLNILTRRNVDVEIVKIISNIFTLHIFSFSYTPPLTGDNFSSSFNRSFSVNNSSYFIFCKIEFSIPDSKKSLLVEFCVFKSFTTKS